MQFVGKVISSVSEFYRDINPSTLSGAIDVVVVENVETGELACSPFHVRFGKLQLLRPQEKAVELKINGVAVGEELRMKVGEAGETFFVLSREELGMGGASDLPLEYLTSPLIGPETPAPIESIEEFKLNSPTGLNNSTTLVSNVSSTTSLTSAASLTTPTSTVTSTVTAGTLNSPEWKWEWGDLPIKKEISEETVTVKDTASVNSIHSINNSQSVNSTTLSIATLELYEFLAGKDYLIKIYEVLARFPARSMITRIYRIDRGLHFHPSTTWPDQLTSPALLNESSRVLESDFLLNPNVVIEESSRLLYQFTWENRKVVLGGSVGAAVVFYAQTYGRILPVEIVLKLAEIAAIRMAKRKFSKSAVSEVESADGTPITDLDVDSNADLKDDTVISTNTTEKLEIEPTNAQTAPLPIPSSGETKGSKSGWRSWWSRSSANSTSASSANLPENASASATVHTSVSTISSVSNSNSNNVTSPLSAISNANVNSQMGSPSKKILEVPPATLSSLISDTEVQLSGSNSSVEDRERSPSKRIIQRTTSISSVSERETVNVPVPMTVPQSQSQSPVPPSSPSGKKTQQAQQQCIKSLRLPSHLLKRLNLKPGVNTISYTVNTRLQGTATCQSRIFFWRSDARVVISDIDGTITKSDALGHLFTMVGKDWTHVGVAQLYSKIAANGYEFLYLTSRAIGQAASTRGYLKAIEQDRLQLPDGPVIMSPDRLFTALHREVIQRRPDEFKIACLRDIQKLFVNDEEEVSMMGSGMISSSEDEYFPKNTKNRVEAIKAHVLKINTPSTTTSTTNNSVNAQLSVNPFYAGFGNRPTDTKSYKAVGISASRIFLINPAGDLKLDKLTFYTPYSASSYSKLTEEVDKVFPPVRSPSSLTRVAGDEAFTDFQYWHGHDGDVRMDLVQMALSSTVSKTKQVEAVVDEQGKPVSPVTLQKQLGGPANVSGDISDDSSRTSEWFLSTTGVNTIPPPIPPRKKMIENDGENDADEEESESEGESESESESEGEEDVNVDSFPFI